MDTDSLYLALAENNIHDRIEQGKIEEWTFIRSKNYTDRFAAKSLRTIPWKMLNYSRAAQ